MRHWNISSILKWPNITLSSAKGVGSVFTTERRNCVGSKPAAMCYVDILEQCLCCTMKIVWLEDNIVNCYINCFTIYLNVYLFHIYSNTASPFMRYVMSLWQMSVSHLIIHVTLLMCFEWHMYIYRFNILIFHVLHILIHWR